LLLGFDSPDLKAHCITVLTKRMSRRYEQY